MLLLTLRQILISFFFFRIIYKQYINSMNTRAGNKYSRYHFCIVTGTIPFVLVSEWRRKIRLINDFNTVSEIFTHHRSESWHKFPLIKRVVRFRGNEKKKGDEEGAGEGKEGREKKIENSNNYCFHVSQLNEHSLWNFFVTRYGGPGFRLANSRRSFWPRAAQSSRK